MKRNHGITLITLVITIIVLILIASITLYNGLNTLNSVRNKNALDTAKAIYQALVSYEDVIQSDQYPDKKIGECDHTTGEIISNIDYVLLNMDYTTEDFYVTFDRNVSIPADRSDAILVEYDLTCTDANEVTYPTFHFSYYKLLPKKTSTASFDNIKKVNRPVINLEGMVAKGIDGNDVEDIYLDNWYNYSKDVSHFATMVYQGETYVWIPRFAYRIQDFYYGKSYENVPDTAVDILFLRDASHYMENGETFSSEFSIHPAFEQDLTGFWIMVDTISTTNSISTAVAETENVLNIDNQKISHMMKNSEYAAAMLLSRFLGNTQITFDEKEFVGAVCDENVDNFDVYSTNESSFNYIKNIKGHALYDTPWNLTKDSVEPDEFKKNFVRHVSEGGLFYFEAFSDDSYTTAAYRRVIVE